uniref:Myosin light chain 11 n=1 Tax=Oryzias latipes TaxID=8090 RepID=A0A3B3HA26_ORYLA
MRRSIGASSMADRQVYSAISVALSCPSYVPRECLQLSKQPSHSHIFNRGGAGRGVRRGWGGGLTGGKVFITGKMPNTPLWGGARLESKAPKKAKRRQAAGDGGSSNVFSMFEQSQIQEYKEAFTIIDQNRDGIISKDDLRDVLASMGQLNVKNEELEAMIKEASGPINFTVFLTMFGEKLKGADPEDVILSAFKVLDPEGTGSIKKEFLEELLTTQCDRFSAEEIKNMWAAFPPDVAGNVDYKNICYVITHGEEKEE